MYKLGLVSISFRELSPKEIIKSAKAAGLSCIEWGSDVHAPKDNKNALKEIAELQEQYGIECCSYGTYFRLGVTPIDELEDYIVAAKILGTDILRLWCGDKDSQEYAKEEKAKLFDECKRAAEIAKMHGVKLCMECHNWTYTNTLQAALELMEAVNSQSFRMYWQPNQFRSRQENLCYAEHIGEYTEHIHVFNWSGNERYPLKDAIEIWQNYLDKFAGDRVLLLEFMPDNRIESLEAEASALYKIAGGNI